MSKMNAEQQRIFDASIARNIAVSAGAGTGKSFSLRSKVIDLIVRGIVKPKEFLIVTFTNEAANSLKNRIKQEIRKNPLASHLAGEVDSMHIDTIDAFRLFVVKKYAKTIGIRGNVNVVNESIYKLEQFKILDNIFDNLYETKNEVLKDYLSDFVTKNDNEVKNLIIAIAKSIDTEKASKEDTIDAIIKEFYSDSYINKALKTYTDSILITLNSLVDEAISIIEDIPDEENAKGSIEENTNKTYLSLKFSHLVGITTMEQLHNGLIGFKEEKGKLNSKRSFDGYERIQGILKEIPKIPHFDITKTKEIDLEFNRKYIPFFVGIAYDLKVKMNEFLTLHGVYTFSDIAKLALKVLEDKAALNEIKNSFKLVMIDEYQDNSDIDDEFFTKIANNNIFVVGDVKQSIYGFKGANPDKFLNKYNSISKELEEDSIPRYTMFKNYRSRKEILEGVNQIFGEFMTERYGGVDYKKDSHDLKYDKNPLYDSTKEPEEKDKGIKKLYALSAEELLQIYNQLTGENEDEKFARDNRFIISSALSILDRLNKKVYVSREFKKVEEIIDENGSKKKEVKTYYERVPAKFSDFAVLTRGNVDSETTRKIFSSLGIPVTIVAEENIDSDIMVVTLLSLINALCYLQDEDNNLCNFKLAFTSIARSFLFRLSDQEIYDLIANVDYDKQEGKLIENLTYRESSLYKKLVSFKENHQNCSLETLVKDLFNEFDFVSRLSNVGNAITSINKFSNLVEIIKSMDEIGYTIEDLIYFFDHINNMGLKIEVRMPSDSNDAVIVETIHKSKGLEFPIVYIECTSSFKNKMNEIKTNATTSYFANSKYGYYLPIKTREESSKCTNSFFIKNYAELMNVDNVISEETRLFYVALTRAQEVAVCVFYPDAKEAVEQYQAATYQDIVTLSKVELPIDEYPLGDSKIATPASSWKSLEVEIRDNKITYQEIETKNNKPSVEVDDNVDESLLLKGTKYHSYMENVDLINKDTSFITNKKDRENIDKVLKNPIFDNLDNVKIFKEYEYFDDETNTNGIIDLLLVYKDHALIVDYKLKHADEEKYKDQLEAYKQFVIKTFKLRTECMFIPMISD